jgi:8-oxo-dGTP pyrophosphatase MutT (NUDIX family)
MTQRFLTVVTGIPVNKRGQFLLSQRHAPQNPYTHHKWQLIGGGMEFGETPEQTLSREFEEETQLPVQILFPHPIVKMNVWRSTETAADHDLQVNLLAYIIHVGDGVPNFSQDKETADVRWFSLAEALTLDVLPQTHEFLLAAQDLITQQKLV